MRFILLFSMLLLSSRYASATTATVTITHPDGEVKSFSINRDGNKVIDLKMGDANSHCSLGFNDNEKDGEKFVGVQLICTSGSVAAYQSSGVCGIMPAYMTVTEIKSIKAKAKVWLLKADCSS